MHRGRAAAALLTLVLSSCSASTQQHSQPAPKETEQTQETQQAKQPTWVAQENAKPGTTAWRIRSSDVAPDRELAAYGDHASVLSGQSVRLFISSASPYVRVEAYRMGWYDGLGGRLVWRSARVAAHLQDAVRIDPATRMVRAPWTPTTTVATTGWVPGVYLIKLTGTRSRYVPLLVRTPSQAGRVVLVSAVATYEAYNTWGGRSLYGGGAGASGFAQRSYAVSMDRPFDGSGIRKLGQYELGPIMLAESTGLDLGYVTSTDLTPHVLDGAKGVVSLGHDEYWTPEMRAVVEHARDRGTNLAFLGANTAYWRVRFQDGGRVVVGYKSAALDPVRGSANTTAKFRSAPHPAPENSLTGMLYECFPARADLVVVEPDFLLFKGTGVHKGTRIPGLVGAEVDRAYPIPGTPPGLEVLSHSPVRCGPRGATYSDSAYFTSPSGAGTFSTGTMSWALALAGPDKRLGTTAATVAFVRTVTRNLLQAMAAGPMGRTVKAVPNLAELHDSPSTATGTAGPVG